MNYAAAAAMQIATGVNKMAKSELGIKRTCPKCSVKFYDLQKNPAECPGCHHSFDPEAQVKKRVKRKTPRDLEEVNIRNAALVGQSKKAAKPANDEEVDIEIPEFEDLDIIEDIDDLETLDDAEVISGKALSDEDEAEDEEFLRDDEVVDEEDDEEEDK